jgi:molecular chaperone HtpG
VDGKYFTIEEYNTHIKTNQTDKDKKVVHIYTSNKEEQHSFIEAAKERGYDVLLMETPIDSHFINMLESTLENVSFVRVDADVAEKLIKKEEELPSKLIG